MSDHTVTVRDPSYYLDGEAEPLGRLRWVRRWPQGPFDYCRRRLPRARGVWRRGVCRAERVLRGGR